MNVEQALREAHRYESRIRELYAESAREAENDEARRFYALMERDEASHVKYLEYKLVQWRDEGTVSSEGLLAGTPDPGLLEAAVARAGKPLAGRELGGEEQALAKALKAEEETSAFYRGLVERLGGQAGDLFARFLEIEEGHTRIVRAELDLRSRTGHWFDVREFDLED